MSQSSTRCPICGAYVMYERKPGIVQLVKKLALADHVKVLHEYKEPSPDRVSKPMTRPLIVADLWT